MPPPKKCTQLKWFKLLLKFPQKVRGMLPKSLLSERGIGRQIMCLEMWCNHVRTISYPFLMKLLIQLKNIPYLFNQITTTNTKIKNVK